MTGLVAAISLSLRVIGFSRTCRILRSGHDTPPRQEATELSVQRHVMATMRVKAHAEWAGQCLPRALALQFMLSRTGITSEVHVGVSGLQPLRAHAWVMSNGRPLGERPSALAHYASTLVIA